MKDYFFKGVEKIEDGKFSFVVFDGLEPNQYLVFKEHFTLQAIGVYVKLTATEKEVESFKAMQSMVDLEQIEEHTFLEELKNNNEYLNYKASAKVRIKAKEQFLLLPLEIEEDGEKVEARFQVDRASLNAFNYYVSLANAEFNQLVAKDKQEEAKKVYEKKVAWKAYDNEFYQISITQMITLMKEALKEHEQILATKE